MTEVPPRLVADPAALAELLDDVRAEPVIALDTESNSFHVYRERVCLLQISTRAADMLGAVLCDGRETVLHGADYDVRCLKREYGWRFPRLFDTMAAARRLGRPGLGLSALVEQHFGARLSKSFQRSDWGRRPLTREQIAYAALDTHFLLPLHELLARELAERGALEAARGEFGRIAAVEPRERVFDPEGYRRIRDARALDETGRAILRALYVAREARARELDRPPFKVLAEATMIEIARRRPRSEEELGLIPGVTPSVLRRLGKDILQAVRAVATAA